MQGFFFFFFISFRLFRPVVYMNDFPSHTSNHWLVFITAAILLQKCQLTHLFSLCVRVRVCVCMRTVVNCSDPGIPANSIRQSKIEHGNFTFGTVVFYDCNPGYYLFGSPVLTCQPTGQWDKPLPECIGQSCVCSPGGDRAIR